MKRFYYISDDLDDLEQIEHDLEAGGIARPQIYLLSNDDVGLDNSRRESRCQLPENRCHPLR